MHLIFKFLESRHLRTSNMAHMQIHALFAHYLRTYMSSGKC